MSRCPCCTRPIPGRERVDRLRREIDFVRCASKTVLLRGDIVWSVMDVVDALEGFLVEAELPITVRRLNWDEAELEAVKNCLKQLTRVYPVALGFRDAARCRLNDRNYRWFVALVGDKVVGTATVLLETKLGGRAAHIEDVVVDEPFRRMGVGSKLVERCLEEARSERCYKAVLDCDESLAGFYQRAGFKVGGVCMGVSLD